MATEVDMKSALGGEAALPPPETFRARANVQSEEIYERAASDLEGFWAEQAESIEFFQPYETVLEWAPPYAKWFVGGTLNIAYNCLDRHVRAGGGGKVAFYWEAEDGEQRAVTYQDLYEQTCRCANALRELGVGKGDRVAIYLPMIPEVAVAMLACARIGAPHTVVFAGFSADSLADRINDCGAKLLITADGGFRKGKVVPLKANADEALQSTPSIEHALLVRRTGQDVPTVQGRDVWWHDLVPRQSAEHEPEQLDSEHPLYLLYTSGTTAKPKGILHTTAGYLVGTATTHKLVFDLKPDDVYWCAADVGWVTGHSYIVYGPLCNHSTGVLYEGVPDFPDRDRWWSIVERYKVSILYTAPTAIRTHMKWGTEHAEKHDLSSLRVLGTVGEPINPEAWLWYYRHIGGERCPVADTWWQTETGMHMITPLPGVTALKPGSATRPFPGIEADIVDERGDPVPVGQDGYLVLKQPWPSMLRGIYGDDARYRSTYWERFPGMYFAGDGARRDEDGYYWLLGRIDDVMNVSGHRISTMEVESALVSDSRVAEAAVIGQRDEQTGEAIFAFVTLKGETDARPELGEELRQYVGRKLGGIARPKRVMFTPELPKTRSGKIMRRLLKDIANDRALGDTTTLADPAVVQTIQEASRSSQEDE